VKWSISVLMGISGTSSSWNPLKVAKPEMLG
jgi:hypothetical protein